VSLPIITASGFFWPMSILEPPIHCTLPAPVVDCLRWNGFLVATPLAISALPK